MEQIFKEAAKKSPIIAIIFLTPVLVLKVILDVELSEWVLVTIVIFTFLLSFIALAFHYSFKKRNVVSQQNISEIDTGSGDFTLGKKGANGFKGEITNNKIKKIKTGGGDFTIGSKEE